MIEPTDEDPEYGLVMPFLPVTSKGGPYDDQAYTAGWEMGLLDARLERTYPDDVRTTLLEHNGSQADLVGMKHGYHCQLRTSGVDGWLLARFTTTPVEEQQ